MKFIEYFLKNKAFTTLLLFIVVAGGIFSYVKMGKLEDAPFTIKQALVVTTYPGASSMEVQTQVTDILEEAIQSLGELYYLKTENRAGISKITVNVKKEIRADQMQQLWDKLRRKVNDAQSKLPAGAGPSVVNDDFGDVLGVFYALSGEGKSFRELEDQAKIIKNDILQVKDVGKVDIYGAQQRTINIEIKPAVLASSGISVGEIASAFDRQNRVVDAGAINSSENRIRVESTGTFYSLDDVQNLTIVSKSGEYFRLGEIADIYESYSSPARNLMYIDNIPAMGIAISTVSDGNVVNMAEAVKKRMDDYGENMPAGFTLKNVYDQGYESDVANRGFLVNLVLSVLTVIAILLFFIGFRNGIIVGSSLVFTIFATLIVMQSWGIALQRMSLAAIIIAMGMLVDNAIVVADATLVNMQRGMRKRPSIIRATTSTSVPLLAATLIGALTFMPVYLSPHITGELLSSVFIVIAVSLMFSWVFAMIQTPYYIQQYSRRPKVSGNADDMFDGKMYNGFRRVLGWIIKHKYITVAAAMIMFVVSLWSFKFISRVFVPALEKQYFTIDCWMPEGTRIETMDANSASLASLIGNYEGTDMVSRFVGQSPPRYYLSNIAFGPQPNYAQILVKAKSPKEAIALQGQLAANVREMFPEMFTKVNKFELSPLQESVIQARFRGKDAAVLDSLTREAIAIMNKNPYVADARCEWRNQSMIIRPEYSPLKAGLVGASKSGIMESVKSLNDGLPIGVYRDNEKKVPLMLYCPIEDNPSISDLENVSVWNGTNSAPLGQLMDSTTVGWEWPVVMTYNRELTMAAMCGVKPGHTMAEVHTMIRDEVEAMELPEGYSFFWDAQFKDQTEAMAALMKYFPLAGILLILILVALFRNFKQPAIIVLILPLSLIGMAVGLLLTGFDFGFFCMAGWLGLMGMIIKNVIVLLDEINAQIKSGVIPSKAVIESTVVRLRPVIMAAATTVLGMIPLLWDVAFGGMAATIIFGLSFATLLTLFVTPALYAIFYNKKMKNN